MTTLMEEPRDPRKEKGTTLMGGGPTGTTVIGQVGSAEKAAPVNQHVAPVVGWLAVIEGPGRGRSMELSFGMNIAGAGPRNRIVMDFGDDGISEQDQFRIAYDQENKKFRLIPGTATNLVYVGKDMLEMPMDISGGCTFRVSKTVLRFVPLCTSEWDWSLSEQA